MTNNVMYSLTAINKGPPTLCVPTLGARIEGNGAGVIRGGSSAGNIGGREAEAHGDEQGAGVDEKHSDNLQGAFVESMKYTSHEYMIKRFLSACSAVGAHDAGDALSSSSSLAVSVFLSPFFASFRACLSLIFVCALSPCPCPRHFLFLKSCVCMSRRLTL